MSASRLTPVFTSHQAVTDVDVTAVDRNPRVALRNRGRRGATLVEFAFFFLLFLMLVVGLMEMGRAVWTFTTIAHAARQGARFAMVHGSTNAIVDGNGNDITAAEVEAVVKANAVGVDPALVTVTSTWIPDNTRGSYVQVQVSYPFQFVAAPLFLDTNALQLGSTSRMVVAN